MLHSHSGSLLMYALTSICDNSRLTSAFKMFRVETLKMSFFAIKLVLCQLKGLAIPREGNGAFNMFPPPLKRTGYLSILAN